MIRGELIPACREAKTRLTKPVKAWEAVVSNLVISKKYKDACGPGGLFVPIGTK